MRPQFGQYPHHYLTVCSISFYQPELVTARRGQHQSGIFSFAGGRLRAFHPAFPRPSTYRNTASGAADLSRLLACRAQHRSRSKVSDSDNNVLPSTLPENCDIESRRPSTIAFRWRATPTPRGNVGVPEGGGECDSSLTREIFAFSLSLCGFHQQYLLLEVPKGGFHKILSGKILH